MKMMRKCMTALLWGVMLTANPILTLFICAGLVTLGFSIFRKAKRAARG